MPSFIQWIWCWPRRDVVRGAWNSIDNANDFILMAFSSNCLHIAFFLAVCVCACMCECARRTRQMPPSLLLFWRHHIKIVCLRLLSFIKVEIGGEGGLHPFYPFSFSTNCNLYFMFLTLIMTIGVIRGSGLGALAAPSY